MRLWQLNNNLEVAIPAAFHGGNPKDLYLFSLFGFWLFDNQDVSCLKGLYAHDAPLLDSSVNSVIQSYSPQAEWQFVCQI